MSRFLLIEPGSTEFDDQRRMKGSLDMPLSRIGRSQVLAAVRELAELQIDRIFTAPCQSARETAETLAERCGGRVKVVDALRNVDHGLWQGKQIDELRIKQPRIYRTGQDHPDQICPPGGETVDQARARVEKLLCKLKRKHRSGTIAIVAPDPLASIVRSLLRGDSMQDLWKSETDEALWELIETEPATV
ncbi:histidine phosphatase family protein [Candidatus Laterigemmans baculatus]|uniref:histidine phosphatase family protein n=1 Tax=Candidatus Laterigemmans baculatus TaxID=2770505 RepID=UPI0013DA7980|nr:histidine phosphatase family protein [Candidatus Laterigemmans baculatus]